MANGREMANGRRVRTATLRAAFYRLIQRARKLGPAGAAAAGKALRAVPLLTALRLVVPARKLRLVIPAREFRLVVPAFLLIKAREFRFLVKMGILLFIVVLGFAAAAFIERRRVNLHFYPVDSALLGISPTAITKIGFHVLPPALLIRRKAAVMGSARPLSCRYRCVVLVTATPFWMRCPFQCMTSQCRLFMPPTA
jgi:hypothetical protein